MELSTSDLYYHKETKTFSQEISCLGLAFQPTFFITIINPKTKISHNYKFMNKDMDGSQEDIYGWNYHNKETNTNLLIIND